MFPYPLLAPWTEDYQRSSFTVEVPEAILNNGRELKVELIFRLDSDTLSELMRNKSATFAVETACPRTFVKHTSHVACERDTLTLDAGEYDEELLITPYVISTKTIEGFQSEEHVPEWRAWRPEGFSIPTAGILAASNPTSVALEDTTVDSVIDLVANPKVSEGAFDVELDDDRIKIYTSNAEKEKIEAVRRRRTSVHSVALHPALYLHAVTEALRNLSDHTDTRWAFTMRNALAKLGHNDIESDTDLFQNNALKYAQELIGQPLGSFLAAALMSDSSENSDKED